MNISETLARIAQLDAAVAELIPALEKHAVDELDHGKRAGILRLRQVLVDTHNGMKSARAQFAASTKHAAQQTPDEIGNQLCEVLSDAAPDDRNRAAIESIVGKVGAASHDQLSGEQARARQEHNTLRVEHTPTLFYCGRNPKMPREVIWAPR